MDQEKKLEEKFQEYKELAKNDKNIDVASLMVGALENQDKKLVSSRQKKWAYLISLAAPPFGLIFAFKFYFSDKDDSRRTAIICVILTGLSILLAWMFLSVIFSSTGADLDQIKQIKPEDIYQLTQ